jgi:hypothetical protein
MRAGKEQSPKLKSNSENKKSKATVKPKLKSNSDKSDRLRNESGRLYSTKIKRKEHTKIILRKNRK